MIKTLLSILGTIIAIVLVLSFASIGGLVGKTVGKDAFSSSKPTAEEISLTLAKGFEGAAKQLNDSAPTMVDAETRMDGASAGPGALLTYHYTFPNYSSSDIDLGAVFASVKNSVCSTNEMKLSLQYGGKYLYSYSDRDGVLIGEFTVDRNDCGFSAISP